MNQTTTATELWTVYPLYQMKMEFISDQIGQGLAILALGYSNYNSDSLVTEIIRDGIVGTVTFVLLMSLAIMVAGNEPQTCVPFAIMPVVSSTIWA